MSDVKRGAPTEDGVFLVRYGDGYEVACKNDGGALTPLNGSNRLDRYGITCHCRHEPLVVPPLKTLHRCDETPCVVRVTRSGDKSLDGVYFAVRRGDGSHVVHIVQKLVPQVCWSTTTELTRAECEAAGYLYPPECK